MEKPVICIGFDYEDTTYLPQVYSTMSLEVCYRCGADSDITYSCDHTQERQMCKECYEFIHWAINNNNDDFQRHDSLDLKRRHLLRFTSLQSVKKRENEEKKT